MIKRERLGTHGVRKRQELQKVKTTANMVNETIANAQVQQHLES